jgi:hypothetical protein
MSSLQVQQPTPLQDTTVLQRKTVRFDSSAEKGSQQGSKPPTLRLPASKGGPAAGASHPQVLENQLFSPVPQRQDSWTIEAQRSDMADARSISPVVPPGHNDQGTPASSAATYTPASTAYLESARKVDDLRSRLEGLEQALKVTFHGRT